MRGYVDTRWGQLHYDDTGSGDRTIVLFHETPLSHRAWERLAPKLARTFRIVAFDTPGYGESDPPPGITTIEEYSITFAEGIKALGLERVVTMGVHTGCQYALELGAVTIPDRVDAVIMLGIPFYDEEVRRGKVPAEVPPFQEDGSHLLESFNRPPKEYDAELLSRMTGAVCDYPDRAFWAYHSVYKYEPAKALPLLEVPALFVTSELDVLHPCDVRALPLVPDGRMVEVPSQRLPLYWTQPDAVAREVTAFLDA